jgi:hypothetical protein
MSESDLRMLVSFRQGLPEADEATARRVYTRATAERARRLPILGPMRRSPLPRQRS